MFSDYEHRNPLEVTFAEKECGMHEQDTDLPMNCSAGLPKSPACQMGNEESPPESDLSSSEQPAEAPSVPTIQLMDENSSPTPLQALRVLDLSVTDIADTGLSFLSLFPLITSLNLFSTKVTDDGLKHVAKLDNLVELDLCGTEISDTGLECLETLQSLEILKVCGNKRVTDDGALQTLLALAGLQTLELRATSVTTNCLEQITKILGLRAKLLIA